MTVDEKFTYAGEMMTSKNANKPREIRKFVKLHDLFGKMMAFDKLVDERGWRWRGHDGSVSGLRRISVNGATVMFVTQSTLNIHHIELSELFVKEIMQG